MLLADGPAALRDEVAVVNDDIWAMGKIQTKALFGTTARRTSDVVGLAIRQTPYGMVRPYVRAQQPLPQWLDGAVLAAAGAILDLAERA